MADAVSAVLLPARAGGAGPGVPVIDEALAGVMEAVAHLAFEAGQVTDFRVSTRRVRLGDPLFGALEALAVACGRPELRDWLVYLRGPICMERTGPETLCNAPAPAEGDPCPAHVPGRAAELGRCDFPSGRRICTEAVLARGRCWRHVGRCTVRIVRTGELCGRMDCRIPRHLREAEGEAGAGPGA